MSAKWQDAGESGFSLVGVLMFTAVAATLLLPLLESLLHGFKLEKHIEIKGELEQLRKIVSGSLSCTDTLEPVDTVCPTGNEPVTLKARGGAPLQTLFETAGGQYALRARCDRDTTSGLRRLKIEVRRALGEEPTQDPLTGRTYDWADLYPMDSPSPCDVLFDAGIPRCESGSVAIGWDKSSNSPICQALPAPPQAETKIVRADLLGSAVPCAWNPPNTEYTLYHFANVAYCDEGFRAVGGGGAYQQGLGGVLLHSFPTDDGRGWAVDCCTLVNPAQVPALVGGLRLVCARASAVQDPRSVASLPGGS